MSAAPQLLAAASVGRLSRSASGILVKAATGFHVLRVDGYSWTKTLAAGERISSNQFLVGNKYWFMDYYPNGADGSKASDYISLRLRLRNGCSRRDCDIVYHRQAQYKFSIVDRTGKAVYEVPAETSTFTYPGPGTPYEGSGCGPDEFITREELERRSETLLPDDCLAIRCDVGVAQQERVADVAPKHKQHNRHDDSDESDWEGSPEGRRRGQPLNDLEYIRRCLARRRT
ncbi:hypothetical protein EJB05_57731, partial [Eragrostis curvula]